MKGSDPNKPNQTKPDSQTQRRGRWSRGGGGSRAGRRLRFPRGRKGKGPSAFPETSA